MEHTAIDAPAEWIKKRKLTTIAFAIQNVFIGCEYGIFVINLWFYLTEMVNTNYPKMFYSLISVAYLLSAAGSSVVICHLADKTREIKKIIFFSNAAFIVGNIIYMIPFSPCLLLFGRIVAGCGQPGRSVMAGELARSYSDEETASVFSILGSAHALGFMCAPGLNMIFSATDIWLKEWHITYANVSGLYMAVMFLITQMISALMISDISEEYDLKRECQISDNDFIITEDLSQKV